MFGSIEGEQRKLGSVCQWSRGVAKRLQSGEGEEGAQREHLPTNTVQYFWDSNLWRNWFVIGMADVNQHLSNNGILLPVVCCE